MLDLQVLYLVQNLSLASVKYTSVLPFWYRLTRAGSPGQRAIKWACVCVGTESAAGSLGNFSYFQFHFPSFLMPVCGVGVCPKELEKIASSDEHFAVHKLLCSFVYVHKESASLCTMSLYAATNSSSLFIM